MDFTTSDPVASLSGTLEADTSEPVKVILFNKEQNLTPKTHINATTMIRFKTFFLFRKVWDFLNLTEKIATVKFERF